MLDSYPTFQIYIFPEDEAHIAKILTELFGTVDLCCKYPLLLLHEAKYDVGKDEFHETYYRIVIERMKEKLQKVMCNVCSQKKFCMEKVIK